MSVQQTSIESYIKLDEECLGRMQTLVLAYIRAHPGCSDREVSEALHLRINQVTGRRNELVEFGLVQENGKKIDVTTNRTVLTWKEARA
jgi:predicted transcriptional regulator